MNEFKKMSKSDAPDMPNIPMVITDAMKISSLESQVAYWQLRYELALKYK